MDAEKTAALRKLLEEITPAPWFWNSYSMIQAASLIEAWENAPEFQRSSTRPYSIYQQTNGAEGTPAFSPEDNAWLEQQRLAYEADCEVASVPAHYGDTATGRHAADAQFIETARSAVPELLDALAASEARVARLEKLLVKGQRDRHGDFHPLVLFEQCKRSDCCAVLNALAEAPS